MQPLEATEFHRVMPIIEASDPVGCRAVWGSVLDGRQPGVVFVDDRASPQAVLVGHFGWGAFFPFGDSRSPALRRFLSARPAPHFPNHPATIRALSIPWQEALDPLFAGKQSRVAFDFQPPASASRLDWRSRLPPDCQVKAIDPELAEMMEKALRGWFTRVWGSVEGFLAHGFGFCLMVGADGGGRAVSNCRAAAVGGGEAEIQVSTWGEEHQRRGYASLVCAAFIEQCSALGLRPGWTCDPDNTASIGLAEKLGFVRVGEIVEYALPCSPDASLL